MPELKLHRPRKNRSNCVDKADNSGPSARISALFPIFFANKADIVKLGSTACLWLCCRGTLFPSICVIVNSIILQRFNGLFASLSCLWEWLTRIAHELELTIFFGV